MSVIHQISQWPRPPVRQPPRPSGGTAEIHILPCIRREPIGEQGDRRRIGQH